jgi:YD repeat-containing protein
MTLNAAGQITSREEATGKVINYVYDSNDRLHRINAGSGTQYLELTEAWT